MVVSGRLFLFIYLYNLFEVRKYSWVCATTQKEES